MRRKPRNKHCEICRKYTKNENVSFSMRSGKTVCVKCDVVLDKELARLG